MFVPGAKSKNYACSKLISWFLPLFGTKESDDGWMLSLMTFFENKSSNIDTVLFDWPGRINYKKDLLPASKKLLNIIKKYKKYDSVYIIAKSFGGTLLIENFAELEKLKNIKNIVLIATPNNKMQTTKLSVTNIFSKSDILEKIGGLYLYGCKFGYSLKNANTVELIKFKHGQFNKNIAVIYNDKKINLFNLYYKLIFG